MHTTCTQVYKWGGQKRDQIERGENTRESRELGRENEGSVYVGGGGVKIGDGGGESLC